MEITYKEPKSSCLGPKIVNPSGGHPGFIRFSDIRGITIFRPCLNLEAREGGWRFRLAFAGITEEKCTYAATARRGHQDDDQKYWRVNC